MGVRGASLNLSKFSILILNLNSSYIFSCQNPSFLLLWFEGDCDPPILHYVGKLVETVTPFDIWLDQAELKVMTSQTSMFVAVSFIKDPWGDHFSGRGQINKFALSYFGIINTSFVISSKYKWTTEALCYLKHTPNISSENFIMFLGNRIFPPQRMGGRAFLDFSLRVK